MFQYRHALVRLRAGETVRELARSGLMGRGRLGALRALAQQRGWLEPDAPLPDDATLAASLGAPRRAASTISSLEPLRALVQQWFDMGVQGRSIHAVLVREHGYQGSYSSVVRLLGHMRAAQPADVTVRLTFNPAEAAQVDFGAGPILRHPDGTDRRTWAFVMTLAYSRHQYVEFVWDQTVATWLGCHRRALEWFGAVPARIIIDNAKCAVIKACSHDPLVQRAYAECAEGYGFKVDACPPHDPQKKGIVESGVKYLKSNFLPTRQFRDLTDLNVQVRDWVMNEAGRRDHGTTRQQPLALFEHEKPLMQPLPTLSPPLGSWHHVKVHRDCHVKFDGGLYSAPFTLVGKTLWLRATDSTIALFEDYRHVHSHARVLRPGQRRTLNDHLPPQAQAFFAHDRQWCARQAIKVGPQCLTLIQTLLSDHIVERLRAAQGVLGLRGRYGATRLEAACARALAHNSPHYRTVKTILATGADLLPQTHNATPQAYRQARFVRSSAELFESGDNPLH